MHPSPQPGPLRLQVHYADRLGAMALAASNAVLGVIAYGSPRPDFLPASCPFATAPIMPITSPEMFEIWTGDAPAHPFQSGPVTGACNGHLAFGAVHLSDQRQGPLEDQVEAAYLQIFDFLDQTGFRAPLRFWNYLTAIIHEEDGLERYRRFNIGRHRAFSARLRESVPPPASCVGGTGGTSMIFFLAGHAPAMAIENPRQMSAYAYPAIYGPRSPSFSRAAMLPEALFISGTASIVGHETRHAGDFQAQLAETVENLHALIGAAGPADPGGKWAVKTYLHDPSGAAAADAAVRAVFGPDCQHLHLRADICRPGLLLEIEAFRAATSKQAVLF